MKNINEGRREFGKLALGAGVLLSTISRSSAAVHNSQPGIKLCAQTGAKPTEQQLLYL